MINGCYDPTNPEYNDGMSPEQEHGTHQEGLLKALEILTK